MIDRERILLVAAKAREVLKRDLMLTPRLVAFMDGTDPDRPVAMAASVPMDADINPRVLLASIGFRMPGTEEAVFAVESWYAKFDPNDKSTLRPSECQDRKEAIILCVQSKDGEYAIFIDTFRRDEDENENEHVVFDMKSAFEIKLEHEDDPLYNPKFILEAFFYGVRDGEYNEVARWN